jgi:amino acid permease
MPLFVSRSVTSVTNGYTGKCCKTGLCKGFDSRQLISLLATAGRSPFVIDLLASGTQAGLDSINQLILMMVMSCVLFLRYGLNV